MRPARRARSAYSRSSWTGCEMRKNFLHEKVQYLLPAICDFLLKYETEHSHFTARLVLGWFHDEQVTSLDWKEVDSALQVLVDDEVLDRYCDTFADDRFVPRSGSHVELYVSSKVDDTSQKFRQFSMFGIDWVRDALSNIERTEQNAEFESKLAEVVDSPFSTALSDGFGASQTGADELTAPHDGAPNEHLTVSASDRYVSVRDNQEPFDVFEKSLDQILQEFSEDHGKNNLINSDEAQFLKTEIAAVKAQIQQGYVSFRQLSDQLRPALTAAFGFFSTINCLKIAIETAQKALEWVLSLFQ